MSFIGLKFLVLVQIGIDIAIVVLFIFLIKRLRNLNRGKPPDKGLKIFESLVTDADKIAGEFKEQLEQKHHLIKRFNEQLDKRIISLNVLLNRADVMTSSQGKETADVYEGPVSKMGQQAEIIELAKKGRNLEEIADMLSVPKGEVRLILDLSKKLSQIGDK